MPYASTSQPLASSFHDCPVLTQQWGWNWGNLLGEQHKISHPGILTSKEVGLFHWHSQAACMWLWDPVPFPPAPFSAWPGEGRVCVHIQGLTQHAVTPQQTLTLYSFLIDTAGPAWLVLHVLYLCCTVCTPGWCQVSEPGASAISQPCKRAQFAFLLGGDRLDEPRGEGPVMQYHPWYGGDTRGFVAVLCGLRLCVA